MTDNTCDEYSTVNKGRCGRPLDERGYCDRAREHGDHLADSEPVGTPDTYAAMHGERPVKDVALPPVEPGR